jgi:hypothetical protein
VLQSWHRLTRTVSLADNFAKNFVAFPPLLGSGSAQGIGLLFIGVSFVLFTMIPKATEIIQGFISGKPFAYGSAVGEAFGPVKTGWGMTGGPIMGGFQRTGGEQIAREIFTSLNKEMQSGRLQRAPQFVKDVAAGGAKKTE